MSNYVKPRTNGQGLAITLANSIDPLTWKDIVSDEKSVWEVQVSKYQFLKLGDLIGTKIDLLGNLLMSEGYSLHQEN